MHERAIKCSSIYICKQPEKRKIEIFNHNNATMAYEPPVEVEDTGPVSPFQKYADAEGFRLVYVARSYKILHAINPKIPNYYQLLETQAQSSPQMAEELYQTLREGMELSHIDFEQTHRMD